MPSEPRSFQKSAISSMQTPASVQAVLSTMRSTMHKATLHPPVELIWECSICGTIEPLQTPVGRWIKRSCACQRNTRLEQQKAEIRHAWNENQKRKTYGGYLGPKYSNGAVVEQMCAQTFESFNAFLQPDAYQKCYTFAQRPHGNLLLAGNAGTGKTHLECAICNYLREEKQKASYFVSAPQFFFDYEESKFAPDQTAHLRLMDQVCTVPVLILDDLDKFRPTEARLMALFLVLDTRYKSRRPTVISTNKEEELVTYLGEATLSRFRHALVTAHVYGHDMRG